MGGLEGPDYTRAEQLNAASLGILYAAFSLSSPDRCWRWYCMLCTSTWLYWYQPDRHETNVYGDPVPVRRAGNLLYDYELASEQVPA